MALRKRESKKFFLEDAPKNEEPKAEAPETFDLEAKARAIDESKMPEHQKYAYKKSLGLIASEKKEKIPFDVYVKIRQSPKHLHEAMLVWPKAKGVSFAELNEWDEIFKGF